MILFSNAKINIGLNITEKRSDGFHNIETVFYPIPLCDIIEFVESDTGKPEFINTGIDIGASEENNLILRSLNLIRQNYDIPNLKIHLHKQIPVGAGLGGGSSNAAFFLKGLNKKFSLNLSDNELENLSVQLGSDCAFFVKNKPVFASGRGEIFSQIEVDLKGYTFVLVKPNVFVSTKEAYSGIKTFPEGKNLKPFIEYPITEWRNKIINDFEEPVFLKHPEIKRIKNILYDSGAIYASMSGSGSSVYGIFKEKVNFCKKNKNNFCFMSLLI